jgi:hypothetical protein
MPKLVLLLLSPRLVDMDTYLPVAMAIKAGRPAWDLRFVTFSSVNAAYIRRNTTLMAGLERCATLHCVAADTGPPGSRFFGRIVGFARIAGWILGRARPVLFCGDAFKTLPYFLWYRLARLRGGRGFVLFKNRSTDESIQLASRDRLASLPQGRQGWLGRLIGIPQDGLVHFHDQQASYMFGLGLADRDAARGTTKLKIGLPTLTEGWRRLIDEQTAIERERLAGEGHDLTQPVIAFFPAKEGSGRNLRSPHSPAETFVSILKALRALRLRSLILIRPHPLSQQEPFIVDTLAEMNDPHVVITTMHPEVMIALSDRVIVNAPTNIQTTSYAGKFIDCSDYSERHYAECGAVSLAEGHGTVFVEPRGDDFAARLDRALSDDKLFEAAGSDAKRRALVEANPPRIDLLLEWMEPERSGE